MMRNTGSERFHWIAACTKAAVRLLLIVYLIFTLPWDCILCITGLAASYYFFQIEDSNSSCSSEHRKQTPDNEWFGGLPNPFKGKVGRGYLTKEEEGEVTRQVAQMVLYDAGSAKSVENFEVIKQKSECVFSKKAKVWGSPDYLCTISLEENVYRLAPTFYKFTLAFHNLGLDAFLIELPGSLYCQNIKVFGDAVRRVLLTLREIDLERRRLEVRNDPRWDATAKDKQLKILEAEHPELWDHHIWVFEFNRSTFFITTFAPFYPETNSRFSFGSEHGYILFQPELSFAIHDLPPDTPNTNWMCPRNIRDKIRIAFREAGREYEPPLKLGEPMVHEIVKRMEPEDDVTKWWLPSECGADKGK